MPALTAPQLALLRQQAHRSTFYLFPVVPATVFSAQINDPTITVGENTIIFDNVTTGAWGDIVAGMTLWVGTAPNTYNVARIRVRSATSAHIVVAENSDVAWSDNYYLTVKQEWLPWSVRQFISGATIFKDFDIAYASQTINWKPIAMMGDSAIQIFDGNPTNIYFDSAESYPVKAGTTIASRAWAFGDGGTSTATTPGNHGYAAAGVYYPTLTVTDTNGQTHLTRRIAALPNRADCYTDFECTSLEGEIDGGWTASFSVRGVSDISEFPDRAPIFFFAEDSYGATDGSVGFPAGRENVILFGYIQASSVVLNPETSECTLSVESLSGQMARELPTPASVHDVTTPAAWDEGQNLNIFRSLVYLLRFQSTVFDIADVKLYNDTTLIKYSDFPEDSLWNMLAQFAHGTRLMRCGVTRTGRLIVARDPNLMPTAERVAIAIVCQLQAADWLTELTIPQVQFPVTCFLCLSGISYDGVPANDPSPLFGMSPGHPPKEYGGTRQLADLALVDQTDANELAGLLVGQDNNVFGPVVIPLAGNWSRAFDPAYQEYVQAPSAGLPTKRGLLLANQYLIVRKISVEFIRSAYPPFAQESMAPTLTCEVYSYPDISTNGDCFTTSAPGEPPRAPAPIVPPPPPNPTGAVSPVDVWTLFSNGDIYQLTLAASAGGAATSKPVWDAGLGATLQAEGLATGASQKLMLIADDNATVWLAGSSNNAGSWAAVDTLVPGVASQAQSDRTNRSRAWAINNVSLTNAGKQLFADQVDITVGTRSQSDAINSYSDYRADWGPVYVWQTTNGGTSWTPLLLGYVGQLVPMRMNIISQGLDSFPTIGEATMRITPPAFVSSPPHPPDTYINPYNPDDATVLAYLCTADENTSWPCEWTPTYLECQPGYGPPPAGPFLYSRTLDEVILLRADNGLVLNEHHGYRVCRAFTALPYTVLKFWEPTRGTFIVAPKHNDLECYAILPIYYYDTSAQRVSPPPGLELYPLSPLEPWVGDSLTHTRIGVNILYLLDGVGGKEDYTLPVADYSATPTDIVIYAAADLVTPTTLYMIAGDDIFLSFDWTDIGGTPLTFSLLPSSSLPLGIIVTTQGTILIGVRSSPRTILRSTNGGGSWTTLTPAALSGHFFEIFLCTEYGGSVGGSPGKLVFPVDPEGRYAFSLDDGLTWSLTAVVTSLQFASANSAR